MELAMRMGVKIGGVVAAVTCLGLVGMQAHGASKDPVGKDLIEVYQPEPMPPGFQVFNTETQGPLFGDPQGKAMYIWRSVPLRAGKVGEDPNKPACNNERLRMSVGQYSIYAPALLPEVDKRPTCTDVWPPVYAAADAKPVGKWTIVTRDDGSKQWAYDNYALYTSNLDLRPGDALGGDRATPPRNVNVGEPAREAIAPAPAVPPGIDVTVTTPGRLITTSQGFTAYTYVKDTATKSNCTGACEQTWKPVLAAAFSRPQAGWTTIERAPGVKQWVFQGKPLYTYELDREIRGLDGLEVPGWSAAYTQLAPPLPAAFTTRDTLAGTVIADQNGKTIYIYWCYEDTQDQLACDHPNAPQAYRFAICGAGDPERCVRTWPMVRAADNAASTSRVWGIAYVNPKTGKFAKEGDADAWRVWTYRGRPVYTYAEEGPGEILGDEFGEHDQNRNTFKAFYVHSLNSYR
jgi:predicted lipoprotein with Yx(FWY)xxD motif